MNVRAQISLVFHLDKCIGCHTCSVLCKNIWTDRRGAEYMWWNNVETKPGTGYPTLWEDQEKYRGGWEMRREQLRDVNCDELSLKLQSRTGGLGNIFFNPYLPTIDDYYEPWTYSYDDLFDAPSGDDQPVARPVSLITGKPMNVEAGPNWDDDLGGSPIYAAHDPNLTQLSEEEQQAMFALERLVFFYLPRICNHCLNPACVAACPSGAIYKRGEDGIVVVGQEKCRGWRMCISGCPYKKVYYNWSTGKSEKCILCYPRLETGQAPACSHGCVGRIRYLGVLLYDGDAIEDVARSADDELVAAQRACILDPHDPDVLAQARADGVSEAMIAAAKRSPVYKFVREWELALPLHPEFRTLPMLFYVPPLLPVISVCQNGLFGFGDDILSSLEAARMPMRYMSNLFAAGNNYVVEASIRKLVAVRTCQRAQSVGDVPTGAVGKAMEEAGLTADEAEAIFRLTALATFDERFVLPELSREQAIEATEDPNRHKSQSGFGFLRSPKRGW